mmetsp:Transcript_27287/g.51556  ORF Transcript_27287/g.51556 Transcript_27287/m.51556 type:complete len:350 (+) Transcript_27287:104-1153(+)
MDPSYVLGWFAASVGMIGFGSFAVPIKGEAANSVDIDPLVMQSYKSLMCFLTSWLVVLLGQEVTFTWWGLVSGLFWVPGGAFNIFAIRNAGLAISQGIVASSIVMVSFIWGNIIFAEPAKSQMAAYTAVWLIMAGLYGMSYYSVSQQAVTEEIANASDHGNNVMMDDEEEEEGLVNERGGGDEFDNDLHSLTQPLEITTQKQPPPMRTKKSIVVCGRTYSRRNLGLLSALICGTWGGSCLVPMHYSKGDTNGLGYVISFSTGAMGKKREREHKPTQLLHDIFHSSYTILMLLSLSLIFASCDYLLMDIAVYLSSNQTQIASRSICNPTILSFQSHVVARCNCGISLESW